MDSRKQTTPHRKSVLVPVVIMLVIIFLAIIGQFVYQRFGNREQVVATPTPTSTAELSERYKRQLADGWYYGGKDQKIPGTPADWVYKEGGRSSCWHKPGSDCPFPTESVNNNVCPSTEWVDCMPGTGQEKTQCQPDFLKWATENCPDFKGAAL